MRDDGAPRWSRCPSTVNPGKRRRPTFAVDDLIADDDHPGQRISWRLRSSNASRSDIVIRTQTSRSCRRMYRPGAGGARRSGEHPRHGQESEQSFDRHRSSSLRNTHDPAPAQINLRSSPTDCHARPELIDCPALLCMTLYSAAPHIACRPRAVFEEVVEARSHRALAARDGMRLTRRRARARCRGNRSGRGPRSGYGTSSASGSGASRPRADATHSRAARRA